MESMTGFGRAAAPLRGARIAAEARSVNNRVLDVRIRTSQEMSSCEEEARRLVRDRFSRGSIQLSLSIEGAAAGGGRLDPAAARKLRDDLVRLKRELKLHGDVDLEALLDYARMVSSPGRSFGDEELRRSALKAAAGALDALKRSRRREGLALQRHIRAHGLKLAALVSAIRKHSPAALRRLKADIVKRASVLSRSPSLDGKRLEEEAAFLASRRDFTEETNRLGAHLAALRKALGRREPVGRNLEFLAQEILRELTTVASKAPGNEINRLTIEARVELEKIREQVYNVE